jgi:glutamate carboxypeptidase
MSALLAELVSIESPSTEPRAVARLADRIAPDLEAVGMAVDLVPVPGSGPLLRARASLAEGRAPVLLLGHLDTVWPIGTLARRPTRIDGDRLYGPGGYDMKAGLVIVLLALRALAARGPLPAVTVLFTPLEEVDGEPYRALMEAEMARSSAVLCFEPSWPGGAVKTARKGSGSFVLRARGRASHAGADLAKGANAILELARQCLRVSELTDVEGGVSANVGVIRGGVRPNVVPDLAEAEVDVRYPTAERGAFLAGALRNLRPIDPKVSLEVEGGLHYPPLERSAGVAALYGRAREVASSMGMTLEETATGGASEASFAAALGIPTLDGLGGDGDGAHAEDEHVLLSSLPGRVALTAGLVDSLSRRAV